MSKYTTEVRFICETYADYDESQGADKVDEIISKSRDKVFDFAYPIFDEDYRAVLEAKILKHYYTREIGLETVGLWKLKLNTKMNEIMPYYNKLYRSELIEFNPMYDVDLTRDHEINSRGKTSGENASKGEYESSTTDTASSGNYFSDTPQNGLVDVESGRYLSSATSNRANSQSISSNSNTNNSNYDSNSTGFESYIEHVRGKNGGASYSTRLAEFRKTFLNIDMMIIDDLKSLFMYLW